MKSALAGMYPAISRDSTESNVGRGGSSVAVISEEHSACTLKCEYTTHFLCIVHENKKNATCKHLPTFAFPKIKAALKDIRNVLSFFPFSEFANCCGNMTVKCLSNTVTDGDLKAVRSSDKFLTDQLLLSKCSLQFFFNATFLWLLCRSNNQHCYHFKNFIRILINISNIRGSWLGGGNT